MPDILQADLDFYRSPGELTELSSLGHAVVRLPTQLDELVKLVQGLLVHVHWAQAYGIDASAVRDDEVQLRAAAATLRRALELDAAPLTTARSIEKRVFGNCRHFSTVLCALLRHQGVPARARCGFGRYFEAGKNLDHWICEVWSEQRGDWLRVDAQLDAKQRNALRIGFDPLDVPADDFWVAGRAWQAISRGEAEADSFGILHMWGAWFVEQNLVRDLAALHKLELLPWDLWGIMAVPEDTRARADAERIARAAEVTSEARDGRALRELFEHESFRVPEVFQSWADGALQDVALARQR